MKRDIKLNMSNLRTILYRINKYKGELEVIERASASFLEAIKEQDSKSYDKLAGIWEENVVQNESDLKEKLETVSKILNNYISDMESYITPNNSHAIMRVDRNDIWQNCGQVEQNTLNETYYEEILCDVFSSWADYKQCFVYNPFENEETNQARKAAQQAEEEAERKRREANYIQLENFRVTLRGKMQGSLKTSVDKIRKMYEEVIIPFENTDDDYKKELDGYYDAWAGIGDKFNNVIDVIANVGSGAGQAVVDFGIGIGSLLSGIGKILGWLMLQIPVFEECGLVPETLEENWEQELKETWTGIKAILSNPNNAMEAIGQSVADTVDEKGVAYSIGYVAPDIIAAIFADKGLGKVSKLGKTDDVVKYSDEVAEVANKAGKHADEAAKAAKEVTDGVGKNLGEGGTDVWDMTEGGGVINGREYSQHAMERMAPDTPSVRAELSRRAEALAESKGLQVGTPEYYQFCQKYVDPRNIPPSVIEDAIRNTTAVPAHTAGTFVHHTADVTVIVSETGKVITVIPK